MKWFHVRRSRVAGLLALVAFCCLAGAGVQGCNPGLPVQAWCPQAVAAYYSWEAWCDAEIKKNNLQPGDRDACIAFTQVTQLNTALYQAKAGAQNGWAPDTIDIHWQLLTCLSSNNYDFTLWWGPSYGYHAKDNKTPVVFGQPAQGQKPISWPKLGPDLGRGHTMAEYIEHPALAFADGNPCAQAIQSCRSHQNGWLGEQGGYGDLAFGGLVTTQPMSDPESMERIADAVRAMHIRGTPENQVPWSEMQSVNFSSTLGINHPYAGMDEPKLDQQQ